MNIYGASGHAKVIIDIAHSKGLAIDLIYDDNPDINFLDENVVVHEVSEIMKKSETVIAIGNNFIRKNVAENFKGNIIDAISHNSAVLSSTSKIGKGTVVMPNACVNAATTIGNHCILNTGSTVDHDCVLEDFVHISPNAAIAGNVIIGTGTHIGIGAVVIPGIIIGKWVTIGAGTVIIKNIPDFAVVVGNPGKIIKYSK